jgi:hypothetical protein
MPSEPSITLNELKIIQFVDFHLLYRTTCEPTLSDLRSKNNGLNTKNTYFWSEIKVVGPRFPERNICKPRYFRFLTFITCSIDVACKGENIYFKHFFVCIKWHATYLKLLTHCLTDNISPIELLISKTKYSWIHRNVQQGRYFFPSFVQ